MDDEKIRQALAKKVESPDSDQAVQSKVEFCWCEGYVAQKQKDAFRGKSMRDTEGGKPSLGLWKCPTCCVIHPTTNW